MNVVEVLLVFNDIKISCVSFAHVLSTLEL